MIGGGRYDGLMESLGGPVTPAVGWAAGIERLAMLVGERPEPNADIIVVVEDDSQLSTGIEQVAILRRTGLCAELVATGSPRKRFDKAVKLGANAILALSVQDGKRHVRFRVDNDAFGELKARLENLANELRASM